MTYTRESNFNQRNKRIMEGKNYHIRFYEISRRVNLASYIITTLGHLNERLYWNRYFFPIEKLHPMRNVTEWEILPKYSVPIVWSWMLTDLRLHRYTDHNRTCRESYSEVKQVFGQQCKIIYDCFWDEKQCIRVTFYS